MTVKIIKCVDVVRITFSKFNERENYYGRARLAYSTGEVLPVRCGGKYGFYLCKDCYQYLKKERRRILDHGKLSDDNAAEVKRLLGAYSFYWYGLKHRIPFDSLHKVRLKSWNGQIRFKNQKRDQEGVWKSS